MYCLILFVSLDVPSIVVETGLTRFLRMIYHIDYKFGSINFYKQVAEATSKISTPGHWSSYMYDLASKNCRIAEYVCDRCHFLENLVALQILPKMFPWESSEHFLRSCCSEHLGGFLKNSKYRQALVAKS